MGLTTFTFIAFCIITLFIYFIIPKKFQWIVLLVSSVTFLFWDNFNIETIIQALIVLMSAYVFGRLIDKYYDTKKAKRFLAFGILIILAQLIYLKYTNLFLTTFNHIFNLFGIKYQFGLVYRNSLIGISYYSLIMISYMTDIYRGTCKAQKNIFKCALFMSYFPILTSGPFIKYKETGEELYKEHKLKYNNLCYGLLRVVWGFFKVLVISQRIGYFVDGVYADLNTFSGVFTILAILLFTLQLYTNFSGSIDIIIGISEILDIKLPENFNLPFFSKTITELWRRWHITLGGWLRDYIFYPIQKSNFMQKLNKKCKERFGKKIGKKISLYLSMLIMWILIGAWHGGAYTFIIGSGILQFVYMFLEDILEPVSKKINDKLGIKRDVFSYKLYQVIRTYLLFSFSMIFFRASSVKNAFDIIKSAFKLNLKPFMNTELLSGLGLDFLDAGVLVLSLVVLFVVQLIARNGKIREKLFKQNVVFRWCIIYILIFAVIIFGCYGAGYDPAAFIYRQF